MRVVIAAVVLVALAGSGSAEPKGAYTSTDGKYKVRFPDKPKVTAPKTRTAVGDLVVTLASYANADGSIYMTSHTDYPDSAAAPENQTGLLDGVRDGMKKNGSLVGKERAFAYGSEKLPAREFEIDLGKQHAHVRLILKGSRLYQLVAIGSERFVQSNDVSVFLDSFEITN